MGAIAYPTARALRPQAVTRPPGAMCATGALKRYTELDTRDYAGLLHLAGEYAISELRVRGDTWLADKRLDQLNLPQEGVLVLGIARPDGSYEGVPRGDTVLGIDHTVLVYGRSPS